MVFLELLQQKDEIISGCYDLASVGEVCKGKARSISSEADKQMCADDAELASCTEDRFCYGPLR